jgi:multiple sugar transport system substrate-binding protein
MSIPAITNTAEQEAAFKWMEYFTSAKTTAEWSMKTGYIAVRKSATSDPTFKAYAAKNPQILVPLKQASTASAPFVDPTGGKITDALTKAADKVEIENIPAAVALKEAEDQAQQALDATSK